MESAWLTGEENVLVQILKVRELNRLFLRAIASVARWGIFDPQPHFYEI